MKAANLISLIILLLVQKVMLCQSLSPMGEAIVMDFYQFSFHYNDKNIQTLINNDEITKDEGLFLQMNYHWWNYLISNNSEQIDVFVEELSTEQSKAFTKDDNCNILGVGTHILAARYHVANNHKYKSLFCIKRAFFLFAKIQVKQSEEYSFVHSIGESVIQYSIFSELIIIPYIKSFFNSDKSNSIAFFTHSENKLLKTEATYFLAKKSLKLDKDYNNSITYYKELLTEYPHNIVYRLDYIQALDGLNKTDEIGKQKDLIRNLCIENKNLKIEQQNHLISQITSN